MLLDDVSEILITEEELQARIAELGRAISADYQDKNVLAICILRGAVIFLSDLIRRITVPHEIDFMAVSSYGGGRTESSGVVRILMDLRVNIRERHVLIVEDIVDTGLTLTYIINNLKTRQPVSLRTCALLNKQARRQVDVSVDYLGFDIPDKFVIGYGLDYDEKYRNLPFVGVLKPELYSE